MRAKILTLLLAVSVVSLGMAAPAQAQFYRYRGPAYQWNPYGYAYRSPQTAIYGRYGTYYTPSYSTYATVNYYPALSYSGVPYVQPVYSTGGIYTPPAIQPFSSPYSIPASPPTYYQYFYAPLPW